MEGPRDELVDLLQGLGDAPGEVGVVLHQVLDHRNEPVVDELETHEIDVFSTLAQSFDVN